MSGGPYRERPKLMLCPRCGEILDHAFDAVRLCMRCEGVWLGVISLQKAFGDRRWPEAQNTWWRSATPCPECAMEGEHQIMNAAVVGLVQIDRCYQHGLWLDRGELGRLMGGDLADDRGDDDLAALRERLKVVDTELESLLARRDAWRAEAEVRGRSAAEYRAWLAAEQARRTAAERAIEAEKRRALEGGDPAERERIALEAEAAKRREAERKRREAERERIANEQAEREAIAAEWEQRRRSVEAEQAARLRNAQELERDQALQRLGTLRANVSARVGMLETSLRELREQVRAKETELANERATLRRTEEQLGQLERERE